MKYIKGLPLEFLCLSGCRHITSMSMKYLPKTIQILDVSYCKISKKGLRRIARLPNLTHLYIEQCSRITAKHIKKYLNNAKKLQHLGTSHEVDLPHVKVIEVV